MKLNLEAGKPRAVYAHTVERVDGGWKATIVLSNRLGVILERHVRFAPTEEAATKAALDALSGRWTWSPPHQR
ncbi:MAG: hypothetical protein ABIQ73_07435 [Acidimicrobiales bacterium]